MFVGLLTMLVAAPGLAPLPEPTESPRILHVFDGDARYRVAGGVETTYEGVLERLPDKAGRYRLAGRESGERVVWDLTLPDGPDKLADLVGQRMRIIGKLSGTSPSSLWPATMEPLGQKSRLPADGVLARSDWQPAEARVRGGRQYIIRDAAQLAKTMNLVKGDVEPAATTNMSKILKVDAIDWEHQMIVSVCAGLQGGDVERLHITKVERGGDTLTIFYKMEKSAMPQGGFGYPAETVLLTRSDKPVRFVDETARK